MGMMVRSSMEVSFFGVSLCQTVARVLSTWNLVQAKWLRKEQQERGGNGVNSDSNTQPLLTIANSSYSWFMAVFLSNNTSPASS